MLKRNTQIVLIIKQVAGTEPSLLTQAEKSRKKYSLPRFPLFIDDQVFADYCKKPSIRKALIRKRITEIMQLFSVTSFSTKYYDIVKKKNGSHALYYIVEPKSGLAIDDECTEDVHWYLSCCDQRIVIKALG